MNDPLKARLDKLRKISESTKRRANLYSDIAQMDSSQTASSLGSLQKAPAPGKKLQKIGFLMLWVPEPTGITCAIGGPMIVAVGLCLVHVATLRMQMCHAISFKMTFATNVPGHFPMGPHPPTLTTRGAAHSTAELAPALFLRVSPFCSCAPLPLATVSPAGQAHITLRSGW